MKEYRLIDNCGNVLASDTDKARLMDKAATLRAKLKQEAQYMREMSEGLHPMTDEVVKLGGKLYAGEKFMCAMSRLMGTSAWKII